MVQLRLASETGGDTGRDALSPAAEPPSLTLAAAGRGVTLLLPIAVEVVVVEDAVTEDEFDMVDED